jgi:hypothetical protein
VLEAQQQRLVAETLGHIQAAALFQFLALLMHLEMQMPPVILLLKRVEQVLEEGLVTPQHPL